MPDYFFKYSTDIPNSLYTPNFSPAHIAWLSTALLLIFVTLLIYRRWTQRVKDRFKKAAVIFIIIAEISLWVWEGVLGHYDIRYSLPLQLCNISVFIEFCAVFIKKSALVKEFAYALSMPSALAALITPGWYAPFFTFQYLEPALAHTLLVLIPVLIVWGDGFRPDYRRLPKVCGLLIVCIAAAVAANLHLGSNYMFLAYVPRDTTLVIFETWFGNPGYELPEFILLLLIWAILYLPWMLSDRRHNSNH
jgi:hypothetical integral membrane protein (TIGR02206 family)